MVTRLFQSLNHDFQKEKTKSKRIGRLCSSPQRTPTATTPVFISSPILSVKSISKKSFKAFSIIAFLQNQGILAVRQFTFFNINVIPGFGNYIK